MSSLFDGLIHAWKLELDARDSVGDAHGTINGATNVSAKVGGGYDFDGLNDDIDLGSGDLIPQGNLPFSISLWVKPEGDGTVAQEIMALKQTTQFRMGFAITSKFQVGMRRVGPGVGDERGVQYDIDYTGSFKDVWTHIVYYYNGGDKSLTSSHSLFINGSLHTTGKIVWGFGGAGTQNIIGREATVGINYFDGSMDEIFVWDRVLIVDDIQQLYKSGDGALFLNPLNQDLISYWPLDADANDSLNINDGIVTGATLLPSGGKLGGCYSFNGTTDYIEMVDDDSLSFTDGASNDKPFSISFWVNPSTMAASMRTIAKATDASSKEWEILIASTGYIAIGCYDLINARIQALTPSALVTASTWTHIVCTYDGSNDESGFNIYVNGIAQSLSPDNTGVYGGMTNGAHPFTLGTSGSTSSNRYNGLMDEVTIWNRELNSQEILKNYNNGLGKKIEVGLQDGLISYYDMNVDGTDRIGHNDGTLNGTTLVTGQFGNAREFNGTTDYIDLGDADEFSFTHGSGRDKTFSIAMWVYHDVAEVEFLITKFNQDTPAQREFQILVNTAGGSIQYQLRDSGGEDTIGKIFTNVLPTGAWHHLVFTYDGSNTEAGIKLYKDGTEFTTFTSNSSGTYDGIANTSIPVVLGARRKNTGIDANSWDGKIDEVMIFNRVLTQAEINILAANPLPAIKRSGVYIKKSKEIDTKYIKKIGEQTW